MLVHGRYPFIHLGGERHCESKVSCPRTQHNVPGQGSNQACVSQKTRKLLGPEDFSGVFSGEFLGSRKAFLNAPENTPDSHPSFSCCFPGFAARAWQWFVKNLNWHGCTELGSSRTLQIKPSFVGSFVESQANFWLFLSFVQFQHRLLYFDWSLLRM